MSYVAKPSSPRTIQRRLDEINNNSNCKFTVSVVRIDNVDGAPGLKRLKKKRTMRCEGRDTKRTKPRVRLGKTFVDDDGIEVFRMPSLAAMEELERAIQKQMKRNGYWSE